ncbi:WD repeat-containing protein 3 [Trichinella pseudospiralis]|uniref:WD repeat-containing protein 3 n=1 Tax=Trichinella pseudospiralis TaxID=6337 RepID=A0A0V1J2W1_TRIPS|nr:WD repeat-containing protein 3 [Trichinella pseudospiralis]KRZ42464.1 WD repeat-containing protein 3 [Trichinella pseudospiralis]
MGLTKQFLKYVLSGVCNIVASPSSSIIYVDADHCCVGACQDVLLWNLKTYEKAWNYERVLFHAKSEVKILAKSPTKNIIAIGCSDGVINVIDCDQEVEEENDEEVLLKVTFSGHRSAVSCLSFSVDGLSLASGGQDGVVIVWDIVNEAGLFRLRGHRAPITKCYFVSTRDVLITSSKDGLVKFWDLKCQHCFYTIADTRSSVWSFVCLKNDSELIVGSSENELLIYSLEWFLGPPQSFEASNEKREKASNDNNSFDQIEYNPYMKCQKLGSIFRHTKGRITNLEIDQNEKIMICSGTGGYVDVFKVLSASESTLQIEKEKSRSKRQSASVEQMADISARYEFVGQLKASAKVKYLNCTQQYHKKLRILILLNDNRFEEWILYIKESGKLQCKKRERSFVEGHRKDIRVLKFSSDSQFFLSGAGDSLKLWSTEQMDCVSTVAVQNVLCATFIVGDQHCVIGTDEGTLLLLHIASGKQLQIIEAHEGEVRAIKLTTDELNFATCSTDRTVKFWCLQMVDNSDTINFCLEHTRTLQLDESALSLSLSKNKKFLAVALLDNTIKIFFLDTFKFFLSLYGHSLSVICTDISDDSSLLISGSADKSIKIWGMDFGDCHKSLFAHDEWYSNQFLIDFIIIIIIFCFHLFYSVTCVQFIPKTHLFFSAGKDGKIKQWCADKFLKICTLDSHLSEIWAMDLSSSGSFLISGSYDFSIRIWEKTREICVLQEEEELERELDEVKALENLDDVVPGEVRGESALAAKRTISTVQSADSIIEALEACREVALKRERGDKTPHPLLQASGTSEVERYLIDVIGRVSSSDLEKSLIMLPFSYAVDMLQVISLAVENGYEVETAIRCGMFIVRVHQYQLIGCDEAIACLERFGKLCSEKLNATRDEIGTNLAALKLLEKEFQERNAVSVFSEAREKYEQQERKKKKKKQLKSAA